MKKFLVVSSLLLCVFLLGCADLDEGANVARVSPYSLVGEVYWWPLPPDIQRQISLPEDRKNTPSLEWQGAVLSFPHKVIFYENGYATVSTKSNKLRSEITVSKMKYYFIGKVDIVLVRQMMTDRGVREIKFLGRVTGSGILISKKKVAGSFWVKHSLFLAKS